VKVSAKYYNSFLDKDFLNLDNFTTVAFIQQSWTSCGLLWEDYACR
jgi:hypothetical protein